ncbi:MAG TPA: single-stranded-DNA-specific exonuclease RecJ [Fimbriimonas sp.]|nr:single-stranded-DNA-specific exonuclease RecJ [Fimbriimonas sp.]
MAVISPAPAPPKAKWLVSARDRAAESVLQRELGISGIVAALLVQRGISTPAEADIFLRASLDDLHSPEDLPDYAAARDAIMGAKERGELIYVHGDYDVDGVTSAATFDRFLKKIGCKVETHVPHRMKEGYGIHSSAVDAAIAQGAKLFLTCDCGSGAIEQIKKAREAGMTVVVTDHHTIGPERPDCQAFINVHRDDCDYPFKELSGAGVVFKLCAGLTKELGFELKHYYNNFLDLACLGTIADVMPLIGENRIIAKHGLQRLRETKKIGLQALMARAEMDLSKPFRNYHVGFVLGPRLNAAGRVDDAAKALQLLIEQDPEAAKGLADLIENANIERKAEQQRIVEEAIEMVEETEAHKRWVVVVCKEGWHSGVVGIVASRLVETYYRPAFVLTHDPVSGLVKGSARSIAGFHLADAIRANWELFIGGGGHAMAAGCSFEHANLEAVCDALHSYAKGVLTEDDLVPTSVIDLEVEPGELQMRDAEDLSLMEPFGVANPEPTFLARDVNMVELKPCKNPIHMQLKMRHGDSLPQNGIIFNVGEQLAQYESGTRMDLIFKPEVDEWMGNRRLKWKVQDFREA